MTFQLVHISDLHVLALSHANLAAYLNKRLLGTINLLMHRSRAHGVDVIRAALAQIRQMDFDHLAVSGDLSNLSLDAELQMAVDLVRPLGDGSRMSLVPGNHDRYTYASARQRRFESYFSPWMQGDLPDMVRDGHFPYVKLLPGIALIGICSAVPTLPFMATGEVSNEQIAALKLVLEHAQVRDRFKIALVHHHLCRPAHKRFLWMRRLINAPELERVLVGGGVDLVLHGHNHRPATWKIPRPDHETPMIVSEAGCVSLRPRPSGHTGTFRSYRIADGRLTGITTWSCVASATTGELGFSAKEEPLAAGS
jgi:3',5'-cyclic AMP phosphodiesterase CpdA